MRHANLKRPNPNSGVRKIATEIPSTKRDIEGGGFSTVLRLFFFLSVLVKIAKRRHFMNTATCFCTRVERNLPDVYRSGSRFE